MEPLLTKRQAAELLGVSTRTINEYVRHGRLRAVRLTSKMTRFEESELRRLICESRVGGDR